MKTNPCPFCKGDDNAVVEREAWPRVFYQVICACGARGPDMQTRNGARVAWNAAPRPDDVKDVRP